MFRLVGRFITRFAPAIVIVILFISMGFALVLPKIEFKTNLNRFLPDNELVRANERVGDYFGDDLVLHFILVEADNSDDDVLTNHSLLEEYDIFQKCKNKANIESVVSIVSIIDEIFFSLFPDNYTGFDDLEPAQIDSIKYLFFDLLNENINITKISYNLNIILNTKINFTFITQLLYLNDNFALEELRQMVDIFFHKDFDYNSAEPVAKSTLILVFINGSLSKDELKDICKDLRSTITTDDYSQIKVSHTGSYLISADLDEASSQSFLILGIVIIILISIILLLSFRRVSYVIIPLITLILAIIWTFGTMIILEIEFSVITVAVIPLLIGLGVDYSVYISKRYQEELHKGKNISEAIENAIGSVGTAMFLAVLTTIIAFMSTMSSSIAPVREFGFVCGLGIFYAFFLTLTFHTSVRWILDTKRAANPRISKEKELYVVELGTNTASRSVMYYPILVLVLVVILTIGAITFGMNVRTEFNNKDFLPNNWESLQTELKLEDSFNGSSFSQAFILLETSDYTDSEGYGSLATIDALEKIQIVEENIADDNYVVRINGEPRTESVVHYVQNAIKNNASLAILVDANENNLPVDDKGVRDVFDYLFQAQNMNGSSTVGLEFFTKSDVSKVLYRDEAGVYLSTAIRVYIDTKDSEEVRKMNSELKDDVNNVHFDGVDKEVTGNMILTVTTMDSLQESQIISTIISVIFALIILIIIYRNFILGLIAITPVLLSSIWILGTMYIFGISINVFTVSITALTIGLGIDYAIHIIERFREEHKKFEAPIAVQRTIRSTGTALFISGLTTVCGFIVLTISPIPPIQHFGIITAMTIIYSSLLAMVVVPILLVRWAKTLEDKRNRHKG